MASHVIMNLPELAERVARYAEPRALGCVSMGMFETVVLTHNIWISSERLVELLFRREAWRIVNGCNNISVYSTTYSDMDLDPKGLIEDRWMAALRVYTSYATFEKFRLVTSDDHHWKSVPPCVLRSILGWPGAIRKWRPDALRLVMRDCLESVDKETLGILVDLLDPTEIPIDAYVTLRRYKEFESNTSLFMVNEKCLVDEEFLEYLRQNPDQVERVYHSVNVTDEIHQVWVDEGVVDDLYCIEPEGDLELEVCAENVAT